MVYFVGKFEFQSPKDGQGNYLQGSLFALKIRKKKNHEALDFFYFMKIKIIVIVNGSVECWCSMKGLKIWDGRSIGFITSIGTRRVTKLQH